MSTPTVHKRQLFHWIGRHVEDRGRSLTPMQKVEEYVTCLRDSLKRGLWMSEMDESIGVGSRSHHLSRRMVCFTENRLSECRFHSGRYGRLGLGFPKKFVLDAGGKPVGYVQHNRSDLYTDSVLKALEMTTGPAHDHLDYVAHFVKPLGMKRGSSGRLATRVGPVDPGAPRAHVVRRQFGPSMIYQSEGEWRVVEHAHLLRRARDGQPRIEFTAERSFLRYVVGADLMTVVFPDRRTQQAALEDPDIGPALAGAVPPVNVFHLDEIAEL